MHSNIVHLDFMMNEELWRKKLFSFKDTVYAIEFMRRLPASREYYESIRIAKI